MSGCVAARQENLPGRGGHAWLKVFCGQKPGPDTLMGPTTVVVCAGGAQVVEFPPHDTVVVVA